MRPMHVSFHPMPDPDTVAAVLSALAAELEHAEAVLGDPAPAPAAWGSAGRLAAQGLPPARQPGAPRWGSADRARRATRWSHGIVGM